MQVAGVVIYVTNGTLFPNHKNAVVSPDGVTSLREPASGLPKFIIDHRSSFWLVFPLYTLYMLYKAGFPMKSRIALVVLAVLLSLPLNRLTAALPLSESFENYKPGVLDANFSGGTNAAPNGGPGNPWWGTFDSFPNLQVVGTENGIVPHTGTNMVRAAGLSAEQDKVYYNLAYRLNNSNVYSGNIQLDWWFYDSAGATNSPTDFSDYVALAYYDEIPTNADYADTNFTEDGLQRLSLGGTDVHDIGYISTNYQARVEGATNGYSIDGWFNTSTPRTIGWHHGRIAVYPVATNATVQVAFYIDDMTTATLTNSTTSSPGFNCIELNAKRGNTSAYYDDITFDRLPAPMLQITPPDLNGNVVLTYPSAWILQSSTNLIGTNFVDVSNATSPYTNTVNGSQRFFRLRN
ncbi:MAG: hypothetical protein JWR19_3468 [Pedosphaera sp.]|nr:hypothetical protein [Pedosphaera sp.]